MAKLFTWDPEYYYVDKLKAMPFSESALRQEYARLRKILQNRVYKLKRAGYSTDTIADYISQHLSLGPKTATYADLPYLLADTARILKRKTSTVSGRREFIQASAARLQESGYDITEQMFESFADFMAEWRSQELDAIYSSEQAAMLYETVEAEHWKIDDVKKKFKEYMERQDELSRFVPETPSEEAQWSSSRTLEMMDKLKSKRKK